MQNFTLISILLLLSYTTYTQNNQVQQQQQQQQQQASTISDEESCPSSFWSEIEKGCESSADKSSKLSGRFRVFEGVETDVSRWPYLVSLQRRLTGPYRGCYLHRCGATLIAPDLLLTAAHCLWSPNHDYRHTSIPNILGVELYAALGPKCRHQQGEGRIRIARYFISEDYVAESDTRGGGDIAILQLDRPFKGGMLSNIQGAKNTTLDSKQLTVVGWGNTEGDDVSYSIRQLRMGYLKHVTNSICEAIMSAVSDGRLAVSKEKEICAYNSEVDSCDGDSGGPLLSADEEDDPTKDVQVGIVSWGPPGACGQSNRQLVGVYTSIEYYLPWIEKIKVEVARLPPTDTINQSLQNLQTPPAQSTISNPKCTKTKNGCKCPDSWTFNSPTVYSGCTNPDGDAGGAWCIIVAGSCPPGVKPAGDLTLNNDLTGSQYDYCDADCSPDTAQEKKSEKCDITIAGCECKNKWQVLAGEGEIFEGCANPDDDPKGNWCHCDQSTCIDIPAGRGWDYCRPGCKSSNLKQQDDVVYVKELNQEFKPKKKCVIQDEEDKISGGLFTCLDVFKMGKCLDDQYKDYCGCTCGTRQTKEIPKNG